MRKPFLPDARCIPFLKYSTLIWVYLVNAYCYVLPVEDFELNIRQYVGSWIESIGETLGAYLTGVDMEPCSLAPTLCYDTW